LFYGFEAVLLHPLFKIGFSTYSLPDIKKQKNFAKILAGKKKVVSLQPFR